MRNGENGENKTVAISTNNLRVWSLKPPAISHPPEAASVVAEVAPPTRRGPTLHCG